MNRCNKCEACQIVKSMQLSVLRVTNLAANKREAVRDEVVLMWNKTLRDNPCEHWPKESDNGN